MLITPVLVLHKLFRLQHQLSTAKKRGLWLDGPVGVGLGAAASEDALGPSLLDLDDLRRSHPQR